MRVDEISGLISQAGSINNSKHGITKIGDGPLFLTANSTYPGDTVINAGRLAGAGTVAAITANGGGVSPGVGIGRLTANGSVNFATSLASRLI